MLFDLYKLYKVIKTSRRMWAERHDRKVIADHAAQQQRLLAQRIREGRM